MGFAPGGSPMRTNLFNLLRTAAVMLLLGLTASPALAARRELLWGVPRDDPAIAIVAIAGGIAVLVFLAWIAVRIGDDR